MRVLARLLAAILLIPVAAHAQDGYPNKPIRMIVPLAAASAVDVAARIVTQKMSENMGQQIVIINQVGASGVIGAGQLARAAPDGYTIGGLNDAILTMVPNLQAKMPWDPIKDFAPVSLVATVEWGLIASNPSPYKSAADLIAAAKAHPGEINYASSGNGSPQHIAMALFASQAGIQMTHVPYRGATQAAMDVAANQIPVGFQGLATVASLIRDNQMRLIGVPTPKPLPQFPEVATISTTGLPGFLFNSWFVIVAPAATPRPIIDRLNAEARRAIADPEVKKRLYDQGLSPLGNSPEELGEMTRDQLAKYAKLIKEAGITAE